jgi:DNA anti-recombination protein RmuC
MKDIPPQVQAMIANMQKAIQAAAAEKQQLMAALTERQSDRALQADQIEKTFEAKLLGVVAQVETKMAAVQQKQDEAMMKHVGAPIAELARGVEELRAAMDRPLANGRDNDVGIGNG